jgi:outer membrane immunogenic protein
MVTAKKLLLISLLSCHSIAPVLAADVDVWSLPKAVPYGGSAGYTSVYNWSGFYLGLNLGGGWARATDLYSMQAGPALATLGTFAGAIAGGQLGFNWQVGSLVFGVEGDLDGSGQSGVGTVDIVGCATCPGSLGSSDRLSAFGTARGRVGFALGRWMLYGTGGLSWQSVNNAATFTSHGGAIAAVGSNSAVRPGYVAGAGIETALSGNWLGGVEYLYLDTGPYNSITATIPGPGIGPFPPLGVVTDTTRTQNNVLRARLGYRF